MSDLVYVLQVIGIAVVVVAALWVVRELIP